MDILQTFYAKYGITLTESRAEEFALDFLQVVFNDGGTAGEREIFTARVRASLQEENTP